MPISEDLIQLLLKLLPGFLAAWVFYSITAHPKAGPFERVVQALIFTAIVTAAVGGLRLVLLWFGTFVSWGEWSDATELASSLVVAVVIGIGFAVLANNDRFHKFLRKFGWTTRTSFPSEWYSAFCRNKRFTVLHLEDGRRLYGWPTEWPDQPSRGHFVLAQAEWLKQDGEVIGLPTVEAILVRASDVVMVEFMKFREEIENEVSHAGCKCACAEAINKLSQVIEQKGTMNGQQDSTTASRASEPAAVQ